MIRELDANGDIIGGDFLSGVDEVKQGIECDLQLWEGENPFNTEEGIDWLTEFNLQDPIRIKIFVRERILGTNGVVAMIEDVEIDFDRKTKELRLTCSVLTVHSDLPILIERVINNG